jgi:hypothetical protein
MKKMTLLFSVAAIGLIFMVSSCTSVNLTSWKDPGTNVQVKHVFILAMFDKLEVTQPVEQYTANYFTAHGLACTKSLDVIAPGQQLSETELQQKVTAAGADAVLVFVPKTSDQSLDYNPPTYAGAYRGWYGGVYAVSPGYYSVSTTYHCQANLYLVNGNKLIWTGDLSSTDPTSIEDAASHMAQSIYNDWVKNNLVTAPAK